MKTILENSDIVGKKIGDWQASLTPEGTILWTKADRLKWYQKSIPNHKVGVYATPHYDKPNHVAVDVVLDMTNINANGLNGTIYLTGKKDVDLTIYLEQMTAILTVLK